MEPVTLPELGIGLVAQTAVVLAAVRVTRNEPRSLGACAILAASILTGGILGGLFAGASAGYLVVATTVAALLMSPVAAYWLWKRLRQRGYFRTNPLE